jgi:photosystem II stability/assembly factor-like uncharacterized protein
MRRTLLLAAVVVLGAATLGFKPPAGPQLSWQLTPTGSDARLRGLSAVSGKVAWASGSEGTVLRTVDGGQTWQQVGPPGTADLEFRDIEAFDAHHAVILSIGPGDFSRVYVTSDAGQHWTLGFVNDDPNAFYDCMSFFDHKRGLAVSDPVDGAFRIIATNDGGRSWHVVPAAMPPAIDGEFAFAASGQCLVTFGHDAWLASGGGAEARVFHSRDRGRTWTVSATPLNSGPSSGIFALAFRDPRHGIAVGGDYVSPADSPNSLAVTSDGGATWQLITDAAPNEYRSGATWLSGKIAVAVGPTGSDVTVDGGQTWSLFDDGSFDTVDCPKGHAKAKACWASGEQGRVARLVAEH